ncbi:MAG TPA: hypothetical protein VHT04_04130 [Stellaceae bacterium]|jgi:hypothetical protein|nr:hypothetical protein [Stellaceae bacterium]
MAKLLTQSDLAAFQRDGYLCPLRCLSERDDDPLIDAYISRSFQQYRDQEPGAAGAAS